MATYYVGWDVGAWNCSGGKNPQSHDAIAVFDKDFNFVSCGLGNIKASLLDSTNFADFLSKFVVSDKEKNELPITFDEQNDRFIIATARARTETTDRAAKIQSVCCTSIR